MTQDKRTCNLCGKELDIWDKQEDFSLHRHLGYGTKYDESYLDIQICCDCMEKLIDDCVVSPISDSNSPQDVYDVVGCECVSNAKVYGLASSIRRAKFPMAADVGKPNSELTDGIKALAQSGRGEGHDQWLTGVIVQYDFTFSNKGWVEAERYHFLDFVSSQSTMHRITKFNLDEAYNEYVDERIIEIMKEKVDLYNEFCQTADDEEQKKKLYLDILYSNPAGFRLTAGMTTNYRQLKTIYSQRKNHRLPEWRAFCQWIETLPYSELITGAHRS